MINKTELIKMLESEKLKNANQIQFFENLKNFKTMTELKKYFKNNNVHSHHYVKNNKLEFATIKDFWISETFYTNETIEENCNRFLFYPYKRKIEIENLLISENLNTMINEYRRYQQLENTAREAKKNDKHFMGCMIDKFLRQIFIELSNKYFWLASTELSRMISNEKFDRDEKSFNIFKKVLPLQCEMYGKNTEEILTENKKKITDLLSKIEI